MVVPVSLALMVLSLAATGLASGSDDYHKQHVCIHFFNKENADRKWGYRIRRDLDKQNILDTGYNPEYPTKVLIHGFNNNIRSESMQMPKDAYFASGDGLLNVIVVDWSELNPAPLYFAAFGNVQGTGKRVAELLDFMVAEGLLSLDKLHVIGHSLGAHVAGVIGENLASGRIQRITGLDPARPFINMDVLDGRLSADDAILVDVIHTDAGTLGEQTAVGHVDFYPNGGKSQPGCEMDFIGMCSHGRAYYLWSESIANPSAFTAWLCQDEWDALHRTCEQNDVTAVMGEHVSASQEGAYYLWTNPASPFSVDA